MKPAASCHGIGVDSGSGRANRKIGDLRSALLRPLRMPPAFWLRAGERMFRYQLIRAQMIERALLGEDQSDGSE